MLHQNKEPAKKAPKEDWREIKLKTLILTEKPSVARDFANALNVQGRQDGYIGNKDTIITWAIGHLVELYHPEDYNNKWKKWNLHDLPILPDEFKYKSIENTEKQLNIIHRLLKKHSFDKIIIATDAGREGEVIARTILLSSGYKDTDKIFRFWTSQALTNQVVKEGMKSFKPASEYDRLWKAGQCRQIADWLVGMNASRAATVKMNDLFSIGRVQTAVLSFIVDRKRERENFKPEPYWLLKALFENEKGQWWGLWFKKTKTRFSEEKKAKDLENSLKGVTGKVLSVKTQNKKQAPPQLYSLTDLQRDANKKYSLSAKQTLEIAQNLYEKKKCISYPRTDSRVLGTKNVQMTKDIVNSLSQIYSDTFANVENKKIAISNKRVFNDAKLTDHHALIPLAPLPSNSSPHEKNIYFLILKRFAAVFHPDYEYQQTDIITEAQKETFRTKGKITTNPGWKVVYGMDSSDNFSKKDEEEFEQENLPPLAKDDPALVKETKLDAKKTAPPPDYTEALLLKDMTNPGKYVSESDLKKIYRGDVGLGTQATRAQIIETLLLRKYIIRNKKLLLATDKGCQLIDTLRQLKISKTLTSPKETARWEQKLQFIAEGKDSDEEFLKEIKNFVSQAVEEFKSNKSMAIRPKFGSCPACGGDIIEGNRGFGCSNWKKEDGECRFVVWKLTSGRVITPYMIKSLLVNKKFGPVDGFVDENGNEFTGNIELKKTDEKWEAIVKKSKKEKSDKIYCPLCGGNIVEGQKGFGCSNWKSKGCRFIIWKNIAQKKIEITHVKQLLEKGITEVINDFISKKGNKFSARLKLDKMPSGQLGAIFEFRSR